jgi:NAD(P)H-dependent FMN reductase
MVNISVLKVKVIVGSVREGRFSIKASEWIAGELKKRPDLDVEILDLKDYEMPFFNESVSPSMKKEPYKNDAVSRFTNKIAEGDAFIIVTPEYNHGIPGVLKNAIDWVFQEWKNKPVSFVSYGAVGGSRSVEQLRLVAIELSMFPIREAIHVNGELYFPAVFGKTDVNELFRSFEKKAEKMILDLIWIGNVLKKARSE